MKTKHILTALALPLAFTACTQDEFESVNGIQSDLNNRPVVGQVAFYDGEDAATRMANPETGAMEFANGDQFGMVLMDESTTSTTGTNLVTIGTNRKYQLVNKAYTNYPFTKNGNVWSSEAELVEGNYFYYMPYTNNQTDKSKNRVSRDGGLQWTISANQNAFTADAPEKLASYNAVKDNQLYIGYEMLNADAPETSLENKMVAAHGTIGFVLKNTDATAVTIKRIVLGYNSKTASSSNFKLTGTLDVKDGRANLTKDTYIDAEGKGHAADATANLAEVFSLYKNATSVERNDFTKNPLIVGSANFLSADATTTTASIALNFPKNYILAQGQSAFANMVVPSTTDLTGLVATVYTDKGIMTLPLTVGNYETGVQSTSFTSLNTTTDGVVGYNVAGSGAAFDASVTLKSRNEQVDKQNEYKDITAGTFTKVRPNEWNVVTLSFGAPAVQIPGKMDIYSTEDLNDFLNYCKLNPNVTEEGAAIEATIKAEGVELSEEAYNVLKANDKIILTVKGDEALIIPATLSNDVLTRVAWGTGANAIVKGEQTIAVAGTGLSNLTLTNEGTLTVNYVNEDGDAQTTTLTTLYNLGTATITTPLAATLYNGALVVSPAYDKVVGDAVLNVSAKLTKAARNYASMTVSGNVEIGTFTNYKISDGKAVPSYKTGTITIAENATLKTTGAWTNSGDITVNGTLTAGDTFTNASGANIYNNFGIENLATVTDFDNAGYIRVAADAHFTILNSNASGEIEIMKRETEINVTSVGNITYSAVTGDVNKGVFEIKSTDRFNTLKLNVGDVTLKSTVDKVNSTALWIEKTGTYKFDFDGTKATKIAKLVVEKNVYMTIASPVTVDTSIEIKDGATIQNNRDMTFTYNGIKDNFKNNGTFRNIGTVNATSCTAQPDGNFTGSGTYNWN